MNAPIILKLYEHFSPLLLFFCLLTTLWKNGSTDFREIFRIERIWHKKQRLRMFRWTPYRIWGWGGVAVGVGVAGWNLCLLATLRKKQIFMKFSGQVGYEIWNNCEDVAFNTLDSGSIFLFLDPCLLAAWRKKGKRLSWNFQDTLDTTQQNNWLDCFTPK